MHEQMIYILTDYIYGMVNSMKYTFDMYYQGYIGTIRNYHLILIIVALTDKNKDITVTNYSFLLFNNNYKFNPFVAFRDWSGVKRHHSGVFYSGIPVTFYAILHQAKIIVPLVFFRS